MIVIQKMIFSFVFVNIHYPERLHVFKEGYIFASFACKSLVLIGIGNANSSAKLNVLCFSNF